MKKTMIIIGTLLVLTLVIAGCAQAIEEDKMSEAASAEEGIMTADEDMASDHMEENKMDTEDMVSEPMEENKMTSDMMMNEGEMAPAVSLKDVEGNVVSLTDFKGEKIYVKFWASWCSICLGGIEAVDALTVNDDFKVITIVTPDFKGEKSSEEFIQWFPSLETENLIVLLDEEGVFAKEFGVLAYPTSAYIGSDGVLVQVSPGHASNESIGEKMSEIN